MESAALRVMEASEGGELSLGFDPVSGGFIRFVEKGLDAEYRFDPLDTVVSPLLQADRKSPAFPFSLVPSCIPRIFSVRDYDNFHSVFLLNKPLRIACSRRD